METYNNFWKTLPCGNVPLFELNECMKRFYDNKKHYDILQNHQPQLQLL